MLIFKFMKGKYIKLGGKKHKKNSLKSVKFTNRLKVVKFFLSKPR